MTFPLDKLGLMNQALALCGDNLCNTPEDGSDEWNVGSAAYEAAIEYLLDEHNWKGLTTVVPLQRVGAPTDADFTDAYAKPPECIHLIWVKLNNLPVKYTILDNQVAIDARFAGAASAVTAKIVSSAHATIDQGRLARTFMTALLAFTRAGIYGGLHEDPASERSWMEIGEGLLKKARTRSDQEAPKRELRTRRMRDIRRIRRG